MGSAITGRQPFIGILIPDPRFNVAHLSSSESSYTQAGPRTGSVDPVSPTVSSLVLESYGVQSATQEIYVSRGGHPDGSCEILRRDDGDATDEWRGWDPPNVFRRAKHHTPGAGGGAYWTSWDMARIGGDLVALCCRYSTSSIILDQMVWDRDTQAWTETQAAIQYKTWLGLEVGWCAALCPLPDGTCLAFVPRSYDGSSNATVGMDAWKRSTAGTWALWARDVLPDDPVPSTGSIGRWRSIATPTGDRILLVCEATQAGGEQGLLQYASADGGSHFVLVQDWYDEMTGAPKTPQGWRPDLAIMPDGRIVVGYISLDAATAGPMVRVISSPFEPILDAAAVRVSISLGACTDLSVTVDEDGTPYVVCNDEGDLERHWWYRPTIEDGLRLDTWENCGSSVMDFQVPSTTDLAWRGWYDENGGTPHVGSGCVWRMTGGGAWGFGWIVWESGNTSYATHATLLEVGGWSSVTMPRRIVSDSQARQTSGFGEAWTTLGLIGAEGMLVLAFNGTNAAVRFPTDYGWTDPAAGNANLGWDAAEQAWGLVVAAGAANAGWTYQPAMAIASGGAMILHVLVDEGVLLWRLRLADGADDYDIELRIGTASIEVWNLNTPMLIKTIVIDMTTNGGTIILVAMRDGRLRVWTRLPTDRLWTRQYSVAALAHDAATPAANNLISLLADVAANLYANLWSWGYCSPTGVILAGGSIDDLLYQENPGGDLSGVTPQTEVHGRPLTTGDVHLDLGLYVRGVAGPGARGDRFDAIEGYDYGLANMDPYVEPSPQMEWRSTGTGACTIAWDLTGAATSSVLDQHGLYALLLIGVNWKTATLDGKPDGGAWATLATITMSTDFSQIRMIRQGNIVHPTASGATGTGLRYVRRNELAGGYIDFGGNVYRPIKSNTEGVLKAGTSSRRCTITLEEDSITGVEPTAATQVDIWPPNVLVILAEQTTAYRYMRLQIASGGTYEGYQRIKQMVFGPVAVVGRETDNGVVRSVSPNATLSTSRSGMRRARSEGSTRRAWQVAWARTDRSSMGVASAEPDYLRVRDSTAPAVGTWQDTQLLRGILEQTEGPVVPVVVLPRITSATSMQSTCDDDWLYGRVMSSVEDQVEMGNPGQTQTEVVAVSAITVEEER